MVLGALRHSGIDVGNGLQRDAELGPERLHQAHIGGDAPVIGGERHGTREGLEAGIDASHRAHVVSPEDPFQGGAARPLRGCARGPAAEAVTQARRLCVGKPWQDLWTVVVAGTGQASCTTDFVPDQAPAVCDELGEGPHGGALGLEGLKLIPVFEEALDLECRSGRVVVGPARATRFAVPGHGERMDGKEPKAIVWTQCRHERPFVAFQAHRDRVSVEARPQGLAPRVAGFRAVCDAQALPLRRASGWSAAIVFGLRPIAPDKGGQCCLRQMCHG
jgi:hypothetical protein